MRRDKTNSNKKEFFNKWKFEQIFNLSKTNPYEAKIKYEEYFQEYPKDYTTYPYYSSILILLGEFNEAKKILDYVESKYIRDSNFMKQQDKVEFLKKYVVYDRLKIFCYTKKFKELQNLYYQNFKLLEDFDLGGVLFYCAKQNGKLDLGRREQQSYLFKQMLEYREWEFFEHIKKHLADYNQNDEEVNANVFVPNFPINEIIEEIKTKIPSKKGMHNGFFEDSYIFKYDKCGRDNNKLVDFFKVVCFNDTKDIITMCPVVGYEYAPYIDLNYMKKKDEFVKVKRKSQIDKFNARYKK